MEPAPPSRFSPLLGRWYVAAAGVAAINVAVVAGVVLLRDPGQPRPLADWHIAGAVATLPAAGPSRTLTPAPTATPTAMPTVTPVPSPSAPASRPSPGTPLPAPAPARAELAGKAQVVAQSTAPDATDAAGHAVSYRAANLVDGDLTTAWRTKGDATGQTITFTFPTPVTLAGCGLTNGYTKTDPVTGVDRYLEERRVTSVTWTLDGDIQYSQTLTDGVRSIQLLPIPPLITRTVQLTIRSSTPTPAGGKDLTAISEVSLVAA